MNVPQNDLLMGHHPSMVLVCVGFCRDGVIATRNRSRKLGNENVLPTFQRTVKLKTTMNLDASALNL